MKKTILFNKNHIQVYTCKYSPKELKLRRWNFELKSKDKNITIEPFCYAINYNSQYTKSSYYDVYSAYKKPIDPIYKEIVHESPLGFFYKESIMTNKEEYQAYLKNRHRNANSTSNKEYVILIDDLEYHISYFCQNEGTRISAETRPWNICDNGMEEHFIFDLFEILKKIKDDIDSVVKKKSLQYIDFDYGCNGKGNFKEDWKQLMTDMFGFPEGPKFQTNDEKILAAGFDIKTSFRNV